MNIKVNQIHRHKRPENYSIERVFNTLNPYFPKNINRIELPYPSSGLWNRIRIIFFVSKHGKKPIHILGDIMFAGILNRQTILTYHDLEFINRATGLKKKLLTLFWVILPIKSAKALTAISQSTIDELTKRVNLENKIVRLIPNPLTLTDLISDKLDIPYSNQQYVLHIGTKANKNLDRTALACHQFGIPIIIVGKLLQEQQRFLDSKGVSYHNLSNISDRELVYLYQNTALLSFCSMEEGFGLPIIEAQYQGCPVLTSNCSSMPEVGGDAAHYVDPYSIDEIRNGIMKIIEDKSYRNQLIKKGFENVKRFDAEVIANQYKALYEEILT